MTPKRMAEIAMSAARDWKRGSMSDTGLQGCLTFAFESLEKDRLKLLAAIQDTGESYVRLGELVTGKVDLKTVVDDFERLEKIAKNERV